MLCRASSMRCENRIWGASGVGKFASGKSRVNVISAPTRMADTKKRSAVRSCIGTSMILHKDAGEHAAARAMTYDYRVRHCFFRKMNTIDCSPIERNRLSSANSRKFTDANEAFPASCAKDGPPSAWPKSRGVFGRLEPDLPEHSGARDEEPDA